MDKPRQIDPAKTFESISDWIAKTAKRNYAPGVIIGISGTDSLLTFLACANAFNKLGKPDRVLGLNFEHTSKNEQDASGKIQCVSGEFNWVAESIYPWLKESAPLASLEIDRTIEFSDDNLRWGNLFSRAIRDVPFGGEMTNQYYFPVGSRNATEQYLGSYTQISKAVSMMPIIDLFKSEVIEICEYLGVPQIAIDKSREIDCDCGRFDIPAFHMQELDWVIMAKKGTLSELFLDGNIEPQLLQDIRSFEMEERALNAFRDKTPYKPAEELVVVR